MIDYMDRLDIDEKADEIIDRLSCHGPGGAAVAVHDGNAARRIVSRAIAEMFERLIAEERLLQQ